MNGTDFLDRVKVIYPDTLNIILSGMVNLDALMVAINHGTIHRFFAKPWERGALRDSIREAFRHQALTHDAPMNMRNDA